MLQVHGLRKDYGAATILSQISFALGDGEHVGLIGPNGAGKSTLLRIITGEALAAALARFEAATTRVEALAAFPGTVVVVAHDRAFIASYADRVVAVGQAADARFQTSLTV